MAESRRPVFSARQAQSPTRDGALDGSASVRLPRRLVAQRPRCHLHALIWGIALVAAAPALRAQSNVASAPHAAVATALGDLSRWVSAHHGTLSADVVAVSSGAVIAADHEHLPQNPASNQKLATAAAALSALGPSYRFTTSVLGELADGTAVRLVLRGHGDPSLDSDRLLGLATRIAALGVRQVGDVLVDQSRFDDHFVPPGFEQQPSEWAAYRAPVSAVALDRNAVALHVYAAKAGAPARAWFEPGGFVDVHGTVATKPAGSGQKIGFTLRAEAGRLSAELSGSVAEGLPLLEFSRRVDDPRTFAGHALAFDLARLGVRVTGKVGVGGSDAQRLLASSDSEPLSVLLQALGKRSDNFYAEMILKALGAEVKGAPARSESGAAVVTDYLTSLGVLAAEQRVTNGSGLYDANRLSAAALVTVLRAAFRSSAIGPDYVAALSIGGVDGTLRSRFRRFAKLRAIRAKTGTLSRAIALSGYVLAPDGGDPIAFSLMINGIAGENAALREKIDAVVEAAAAELWGAATSESERAPH
jgi:D-alanyl-D-alanine carboxypeptidase/D-alanyl-D-alanine-endopeptidase (penicillin-binding protein 4)